MITLSICITIKDRSRVSVGPGRTAELFPQCVRSILAALPAEESIELVVSDFNSTDWPLQDWLPELCGDKLPYTIVQSPLDRPFHHGFGRNIAAKTAKGEYLLFLDTDMIISPQIIEHGLAAVRAGKLYFPICFYYLDADHEQGFWADGAKGISMMPQSVYQQSGGWPQPPFYTRQVNVDQAFYSQIRRLNLPVVNEREEGYYHQFHPGKSVNTILTRSRELIVNTHDAAEMTNLTKRPN